MQRHRLRREQILAGQTNFKSNPQIKKLTREIMKLRKNGSQNSTNNLKNDNLQLENQLNEIINKLIEDRIEVQFLLGEVPYFKKGDLPTNSTNILKESL